MLRQELVNARTDSALHRAAAAKGGKRLFASPASGAADVPASSAEETETRAPQAVFEWLSKPPLKPACEAVIRMPSGVTIWNKIRFVVDFRDMLFGRDFDLSFSKGYSLRKFFNL